VRKVTAAWTIQGDRYEGKGFRVIDMKARGSGFEQREESKRCSDVRYLLTRKRFFCQWNQRGYGRFENIGWTGVRVMTLIIITDFA
jgi:hypothetical protein